MSQLFESKTWDRAAAWEKFKEAQRHAERQRAEELLKWPVRSTLTHDPTWQPSERQEHLITIENEQL